MARCSIFVALGAAWVAMLVVVGAYAGWVFVAVKSASVTAVAEPSLKGVAPDILARWVGGQVTRSPFSVAGIVSFVAPALLAALLAGARGGPRITWQISLCAGALVVAIISHAQGVQLELASDAFWEALGGGKADAIVNAQAALSTSHARAQILFVTLIAFAVATTVAGAAHLTRRASLASAA